MPAIESNGHESWGMLWRARVPFWEHLCVEAARATLGHRPRSAGGECRARGPSFQEKRKKKNIFKDLFLFSFVSFFFFDLPSCFPGATAKQQTTVIAQQSSAVPLLVSQQNDKLSRTARSERDYGTSLPSWQVAKRRQNNLSPSVSPKNHGA